MRGKRATIPGKPAAPIEWRDEFALGIPAVDREHRELIERINFMLLQAHATDGHAAGRFLGALYTAIAAHFALEEHFMAARRYDRFAEHKAQHKELLGQLREIMRECESGGFAGCSDRLAPRLRDWFWRHFQTMDSRLHRLLG